MRLFGKTNIDFLSIRRTMYIASSIIIAIGMVSLVIKGIDYGIDFRGGTELAFSFEQPPDIGEIRSALATVGLSRSEIKFFGTEGDILIRTAEQAEGTIIGDRIQDAIRTAFPDRVFQILKQYKISPKVGEEMRRDALYSIVASLAIILLYIGFRFKFVYGVGAVIALFHDVLVTLGIISLLDGVFPVLNLEITLEVVAAFLTLVGVSVNDTVVVFDRIRENLKIYRSMSLQEVINKSLNDTLSRTIITSGTIFVVLLTLLLVGGEVTRGFAFTLTVGILTGTYSSIYIASAAVLDWNIRKQKTSGTTKP
jgi:preprotein translocase subunit SecF